MARSSTDQLHYPWRDFSEKIENLAIACALARSSAPVARRWLR
jgi:hypothetical protein